MSALLTVAAIWVGAVAAVLTPLVYGFGNRWWTNYWGRTLLFKDVVIALAYGRSVTSLIVNHGAMITPTGTTVATSVAMAIALVANLAVMIRVTLRRVTPVIAVGDVVETGERDPVS